MRFVQANGEYADAVLMLRNPSPWRLFLKIDVISTLVRPTITFVLAIIQLNMRLHILILVT
jgi:hypothetical protein